MHYELKDIKQLPTESVWDFDQKFKALIDQVNFEFAPKKHKEWFIAALLPHIRLPLMQHKLQMQDDALEMAMKLEDSPLAETNTGMTNLQNQLANLTLQMHEIRKGKEIAQDIWCIKCKAQGHTKDDCPVFVEYLASGAPNPLAQTQGPWCELCRTRGHLPQQCPMLQKYIQTTKNLYCTFCIQWDTMNIPVEPMISC